MRSDSGYFKVQRHWMEHPIFAPEPFTEREAWLWLIESARWQDEPYPTRVGKVIITVHRGQCAFSVRFLAEKWGWSKSRVDRFLARIAHDSMVSIEAGQGANRITICNYDKYQVDRDTSRDRSGTEAGQKRDKEEERKNIILPPIVPQNRFDEFWQAYPKQRAGNREAAAKAYRQALDRDTEASILAGVRAYATSDEVARGFAKGAAAWLKDDRWRHQYQTQPQARALDSPSYRMPSPAGG